MIRPDEGTVLDRRTLNRALLARQHLLERVALPVPFLIEHLVGMQAQVPRDPYIGLRARLRDFDPAELEHLLLERLAVRMTLMRTTLHLVTAGDATKLRSVVQEVCDRGFRLSPFRRRLDGVGLDELQRAGRALLAEHPRTISERGLALIERWPDSDRQALAYAVRYQVPVVQVTPRGLWGRSGAPRLAPLDSWLGPDQGGDSSPDAALDETVLRYLRAFGPATAADVRTWPWLSGAGDVLGRLRPELRSYRDEAGRESLDVEDGMFADPDQPAPVRFLGEYDNVFLSHADRSRITGDLSWGATFARKGSFFVDGVLAGAWGLKTSQDSVTLEVEPMKQLSAASQTEVVTEAEALLQFLAPGAISTRVLLAAA